RPEGWSEHLAFVRADGVEIGHLAQAPRTDATIEQTLRNVERATRLTGMSPALENIATLFEPPMSTMREPPWTTAIVRESRAPFLIDLHNAYANASNGGRDPLDDLHAFPLDAVRMVHISGGVWIEHESGARRLLDDHLHAVPEAVFAM